MDRETQLNVYFDIKESTKQTERKLCILDSDRKQLIWGLNVLIKNECYYQEYFNEKRRWKFLTTTGVLINKMHEEIKSLKEIVESNKKELNRLEKLIF